MLEITITFGSHSRRIAGRELVTAMQASATLTTLVRLATSSGRPQVVHGEEGVGGESGPLELNAENISALTRSVPERSERSERVTRPGARELGERAELLASTLHDLRSLAWYRHVVARVPEDVIRDALARARDLPTADIRRSRAALFTSIVRPYLAPYAHPPSDPS